MKCDCNANILNRYLQKQGMKRDCEQNQKREDFLGDHPVSPVTSRDEYENRQMQQIKKTVCLVLNIIIFYLKAI